MITVFLKFADKSAAVAAARSFMTDESVDPEVIPLMGYTDDGTRFDLALVGGDGVYRSQIDVEKREVDGVGEIDVPIFADQPGFFVNLLWHGDESNLPDFGAARIYPESPSQVFTE